MPVKVLVWYESLAGGGHAQVANKMMEAISSAAKKHGEPVELAVVSSSFEQFPGLAYGGGKQFSLEKMYTLSPTGEKQWTNEQGRYHFQTSGWREKRVEQFKEVLAEYQPDMIITEQWPFERGNHSPELDWLRGNKENLLGKPLLVGTLRDIPFPGNGGVVGESPDTLVAVVTECLDKVLMFSDAAVLPLSRSAKMEFGSHSDLEERIAGKLEYVGFPVVRKEQTVEKHKEGLAEVIVSHGGGNWGHALKLLESAIRAADDTQLNQNPWTVMVNKNCPPQQFQQLQDLAAQQSTKITVQYSCGQQEFEERLRKAAASISMAGQNTSFEVFQAGIPAVLAPIHHERGLTEQEIRTQAFAEKNMLVSVPHDLLGDPQQMAQAVSAAVNLPTDRPSIYEYKHNGFANAAETVLGMLNERERGKNLCPKMAAALTQFRTDTTKLPYKPQKPQAPRSGLPDL